jgi:TPR repeat protein
MARKESAASGGKNQKAHPTPPATKPGNSPASTAEQNGSEELQRAQKYLDGFGSRRDTQQAVPWLWRAVAKQNATATMLLSDLYLRGDGVAKNCDQARLLLDAAARKGNPAAAERLRNLKSFGCQ